MKNIKFIIPLTRMRMLRFVVDNLTEIDGDDASGAYDSSCVASINWEKRTNMIKTMHIIDFAISNNYLWY